ncbi:MAG: hypothetical protein IIV24_01470 [Alistipes sp.]|nr:hypothetical protein [Alistipes sp.]MBR0339565.1 hypothetical protein [Alistipes sp.]
MKRFYCGGRFYFDCREEQYQIQAAEDYRSKLLGGADKMLYGEGELVIKDGISYIGPYYFETEDMEAEDIVAIELEMINRCTDAIFVLDEADCPGTITELLYAAMRGKRIHIFYKEHPSHEETESELHTPCWFPIHATKQISEVKVYKYRDYSLLAELIFNNIIMAE